MTKSDRTNILESVKLALTTKFNSTDHILDELKFVDFQDVHLEKIIYKNIYESRYKTPVTNPSISNHSPRKSKAKSYSNTDLWSLTLDDIALEFKNHNIHTKLHDTYYTDTCEYCNGEHTHSCSNCNGTGFSHCSHCDDSGHITCPKCFGYASNSCSTCFGQGYSVVKNFQTVEDGYGGTSEELVEEDEYCIYCLGSGTIECDCHNGKIICTHCSGSKKLTCPTCQGMKTLVCDFCNGQSYTENYDSIKQNFALNQCHFIKHNEQIKRTIPDIYKTFVDKLKKLEPQPLYITHDQNNPGTSFDDLLHGTQPDQHLMIFLHTVANYKSYKHVRKEGIFKAGVNFQVTTVELRGEKYNLIGTPDKAGFESISVLKHAISGHITRDKKLDAHHKSEAQKISKERTIRNLKRGIFVVIMIGLTRFQSVLIYDIYGSYIDDLTPLVTTISSGILGLLFILSYFRKKYSYNPIWAVTWTFFVYQLVAFVIAYMGYSGS